MLLLIFVLLCCFALFGVAVTIHALAWLAIVAGAVVLISTILALYQESPRSKK